MNDLLATIAEARGRFMELVAEVRPELHRYCARMTGSVFDGEDVVQDTLAKAWYALAEMESPPPLRPWLFRIAHNAAMDFLRGYEHRKVEAISDIEEVADMVDPSHAEKQGPDGERVETALKLFAALPPRAAQRPRAQGRARSLARGSRGHHGHQRRCGEERARARPRERRRGQRARAASAEDHDLDRIRRYADLFNAQNWEGLRAQFGEETRLHVVSRYEVAGRCQPVLHALRGHRPGGAPARARRPGRRRPRARDVSAGSDRPAYFVLLEWRGDRIAEVRTSATSRTSRSTRPSPPGEGRTGRSVSASVGSAAVATTHGLEPGEHSIDGAPQLVHRSLRASGGAGLDAEPGVEADLEVCRASDGQGTTLRRASMTSARLRPCRAGRKSVIPVHHPCPSPPWPALLSAVPLTVSRIISPPQTPDMQRSS
jgi:RNA polymerase sigma-70 factor (ECF subfamily)